MPNHAFHQIKKAQNDASSVMARMLLSVFMLFCFDGYELDFF